MTAVQIGLGVPELTLAVIAEARVPADLETRGSFAERFCESGIALRELLEGACSTPATARPECGT